MKKNNILKTNAEDYAAKLKDLKEEYFNLRFQHGVGQLENTSALSKVKKDIARINTLIRAQEL